MFCEKIGIVIRLSPLVLGVVFWDKCVEMTVLGCVGELLGNDLQIFFVHLVQKLGFAWESKDRGGFAIGLSGVF